MHHRYRSIVALAPLLALAGCGGAGGSLGSAGTTAATPTTGDGSSSGSGTGTGTGTTTPTDTTSPATTSAQANMFDVSATTTFSAIGSLQSLIVDKENGTLYNGNASTVAAASGSISYNPRDGIFVLTLDDQKANVARSVTFQDPNHRATADSARDGDYHVPLLAGFNYLQAFDDKANLTFFYKRPVAGSFVTIAAFERFQISDDKKKSTNEQGAFVFGDIAPTMAVPTSGTGHFAGDFLASMAGQQNGSTSVLQWLSGTSSIDADFGKRTLTLGLTGTVGPGYVEDALVTNGSLAIPEGSGFAAQGSASWTKDNVAFSGKIASASFTVGGQQVAIDLTPVSGGTASGGASSIDGTFYGAKAQQLGGNLRITGGTPDQRVDILGAFTGGK